MVEISGNSNRLEPDDLSTPARLHANSLEILKSAGLPLSIRSHPPTGEHHSPSAPRTRTKVSSPGLALIATRNFLPFAKLTAQTFLTYHPEFEVFLLLVDGEPADGSVFTEGCVILLRELGFEDAGWYSAKFTASELSNALKPVFLRYLATFIDEIIYLASDIAVFSRFEEVIELLKTSSMVLESVRRLYQ